MIPQTYDRDAVPDAVREMLNELPLTDDNITVVESVEEHYEREACNEFLKHREFPVHSAFPELLDGREQDDDALEFLVEQLRSQSLPVTLRNLELTFEALKESGRFKYHQVEEAESESPAVAPKVYSTGGVLLDPTTAAAKAEMDAERRSPKPQRQASEINLNELKDDANLPDAERKRRFAELQKAARAERWVLKPR